MGLTSLSLSRASWSIVTEAGTQWLELPWGAEALPMPGPFAAEQAYQVERVELPLQTKDHETGETRQVPTVLSFSCPTPTMKYCN